MRHEYRRGPRIRPKRVAPAGAGGTDRPTYCHSLIYPTHRTVPEDYFGQGTDNASFFYLPVNVPGGTGPNHGRFGRLGRNTFRGPGFHQFDVALIKDMPFGHRRGAELSTIEFRAEFFNVFNPVNFGLPANIVRGVDLDSSARPPARPQIQFSLKFIY
jgi:hypothetical protein